MASTSRKASPRGPAGKRPRRLSVEARRHRLVGELEQRLRDRCGLPPGARLVVAVSGGPDSLALLLGALALRQRGGRGRPAVDPVAVHVNHHLRDSADGDAAFVADVCGDFAVPLHTRDVYPARCPGNVAANARRLRYEALAEAAASVDAEYVAVGHHAGDQLETMLIALGRGRGLDGLSGMAWRRPLGDGIELVRPLLLVSRSDCEAMCAAAGIRWREDPGNTDPATIRGRLRRDVIAVLEELWPSAALGASLAAEEAAAARTALDQVVAGVFGDPSVRTWDRSRLGALPVPLIAAGLRRAALDAAPGPAADLGRAQVLPVAEAIRDDVRRPRAWDWGRGLRVRVTARQVSVVLKRSPGAAIT
jgi:tRNA(Ile)-lysidine synthetase-like protein